MEEKANDKLRIALEKLERLEAAIRSTKGIGEDVLDLRMLMEFIKEQLPRENTPAADC